MTEGKIQVKTQGKTQCKTKSKNQGMTQSITQCITQGMTQVNIIPRENHPHDLATARAALRNPRMQQAQIWLLPRYDVS